MKKIFLTDIEAYYKKIMNVKYPFVIVKCCKHRSTSLERFIELSFSCCKEVIIDITDFNIEKLENIFQKFLRPEKVYLYNSTLKHFNKTEYDSLVQYIADKYPECILLKHVGKHNATDTYLFTNQLIKIPRKEVLFTDICNIDTLNNIKLLPCAAVITNIYYKASVLKKAIYFNTYINKLQWLDPNLIQHNLATHEIVDYSIYSLLQYQECLSTKL